MARVIAVRSARKHHKCELCNGMVLPGKPYKHVSIKTGPYSSQRRVRCDECPTWQIWELSNSLTARLAHIEYSFGEELSTATTEDEVRDALVTAADSVRELAEEKRESAQNIEEGFGHATSASDDLNDIADNLESWADDIDSADIPEFPEPEETECEDCNGTGKAERFGADDCETCNSEGTYTPDEPTEDQITAWLEEVLENLTIVSEPPV